MADEADDLSLGALAMPASTEAAGTGEERIHTEPTDPSASGEGEEAELETIEIEWDDGKKYAIPKPIRDGILRNKDYTQGKQKLAENQRALEAERGKIEERLKATDEELDARAQLRAVKHALEQNKGYDWNTYQQHRNFGLNGEGADPIGADNAWNYLQHIRQQEGELSGKLSTLEKQRTQAAHSAAEADLNKRAQETLAEAPKFIPGWTPETAQKTINEVLAYANSEGIPEQFVRSNWGPQLLKILHRAQIGEQLLKTRASAKPEPQPDEKPTTTVKAKGNPPRGLSDDLSPEEWVKRREAQLKAKRA